MPCHAEHCSTMPCVVNGCRWLPFASLVVPDVVALQGTWTIVTGGGWDIYMTAGSQQHGRHTVAQGLVPSVHVARWARC